VRNLPVCLAIDLDGVQCAVLSFEPQSAFPPDLPPLDGETAPPRLNPYGRGRGVAFRASRDLGDPSAWPWDDAHQGRHFVRDATLQRRRDQMSRRWFAFAPHHPTPYRVRFVHQPGSAVGSDPGRVALWVDDVEVHSDVGAAYRQALPTRKIQVLSFTTCVIDDLVVKGRLSRELRAWLDAQPAKATR
jgi:hypothetical protein